MSKTSKTDLVQNEQVGGGLLDDGPVGVLSATHDDAAKATAKGQCGVTWKFGNVRNLVLWWNFYHT